MPRMSSGSSTTTAACGVAVNKTEALKWCRVAVELGDTFVQGAVTKLEAELAAA